MQVHYWQHGQIGPYKVNGPLVLGHESAGIVVSCGNDVKSLACGDRVAVEPGVGCCTCEDCRAGKYNLCADMKFAATPPYDGTLARYYRVPEECCFQLPASVSLLDGALIEPLAIAVHCCKLAGDMQGKAVTVFGAGPVGQLCSSVARAFGADTVLVADVVASRLEFALQKGATHIYQMQKMSCHENAVRLLKSAEQHNGSDIVIDATGAQPCIETGIEALRRGGIFVQAGLGQPNIMFPVGLICDKEAVFRGSFRYGPGDYKLAVALVACGRVDLEGFVTQVFPFSEAQQAFETVFRKEGIKSVICGPDINIDELMMSTKRDAR
jgi:L-iditol 2-dehydrogenase